VQPGQVIAGQYQLEEKIGSGGMGIVWRATDRQLDRVVAMKRAHASGDGPETGGLPGEARIAAGFQHPNIVTVYALVTEGTDHWMVMEYVPSRSLAQLIEEKHTLPPAQVAHLGAQIAAALAAVHENRVVHGDVKPGNVLVTTSGVAKLTDFGVSRTVRGKVTLTSTGPVMITPAYAAPEVAGGKKPTAAADVFSLGAALLDAVEGGLPFGSAMIAARQAEQGEVTPFRLAGPLAPVLATMLATDPASRPSAEVAGRLLREIVADRGKRPSEPEPPPSRRPSRRLVAVGAIVLVIVGVAVGILTSRPAPQPVAATRSAVIGDPRTADPCGLMSAAMLSRFGQDNLDAAYGNFDRCDVLVQAGGGQVDVEDQFLNPTAPAPTLPGTVLRIGSVGVMRGTVNNQECLRTVLLADQNLILVSAHVTGDQPSSADLCAMAESATQTAVTVLNRSAVPRRGSAPDPHSLATVDACKLLDGTSLAIVPGIDANQADARFADWECKWSSNSTNTTVDVRFDRNSPLTAADGSPVQIGSRPAFVQPGDDGPGTCAVEVEVEHRTYTSTNVNQIAEIVRVAVAGSALQSQLCSTATQLAGAAVTHLPPAS
jgi:hypothetical protein